MKINSSKTQFIILGSQQNIRNIRHPTINFMDSVIEVSKTAKNLGVVFDRCMSFTSHVDDVIRRCTGTLRGLGHIRHCIPERTIITLVEGLVLSVVRYCLSVYGACTITQIRRLQKLINFGARVISGRRKFDHISDVIRRLGWLRAEYLIEYHCLTTLKKILLTGHPAIMANSLASRQSVHGRNTRQNQRLQTPVIRTESGRRRFLYNAVRSYNDLPTNVRDATNITVFKTRLKVYLREQQLNDA